MLLLDLRFKHRAPNIALPVRKRVVSMKSMQTYEKGHSGIHFWTLHVNLVFTQWISVITWSWLPCDGLENRLTRLTENDWMDVSTQ